jgi:hypothetical protein
LEKVGETDRNVCPLGKELGLRIIGHIPPARPGRVRFGKGEKA